ncbi:MAG: hypothetical protein A2X46_08055 [Lentisphaerae bacterium GWF2_57_35]|nr:MAG: hypothetical protein A2X46_08055 [Lentisphaerae bacterium GWF2_57_35]
MVGVRQAEIVLIHFYEQNTRSPLRYGGYDANLHNKALVVEKSGFVTLSKKKFGEERIRIFAKIVFDVEGGFSSC